MLQGVRNKCPSNVDRMDTDICVDRSDKVDVDIDIVGHHGPAVISLVW